jgi:hypothetical protein
MPVTAKLSRQFYERLGDEVTNELVDWLNQVDTSYRLELRELNESSFGRFDANVERRFAEFDANVERRFAEADAKVERRFVEFEHRFVEFELRTARELGGFKIEVGRRITMLEAKVDSGFDKIQSEMTAFKAELIKWMFLFWLGTVATTLAISQAIR